MGRVGLAHQVGKGSRERTIRAVRISIRRRYFNYEFAELFSCCG
jgi:hypothetical protein